MTTRWFSLRRRLLTQLLRGITAAWLATSIWVYIGIHHELDDLLEDWPAHSEETVEEHDDLIRDIARRLLSPMLFGLPLLGLWIWLATWRALKPLDDVAEQITARAPDRLQPLAPASAPREIRPLVNAINDLFARVERTLESERRFTADAAHELRAPLALATRRKWRARGQHRADLPSSN
jgi:signal transduction histidine kinase